MENEQKYYEFERFWNNEEYSYEIGIDKINITFDLIRNDVTTLLDAACGNGIFTNMVAEKFRNIKVVAFDRSETALKYVKTEKHIASIDSIPFRDKEFDLVTAHDVIEHLPVGVYEKSLQELARVARKYIIIAVPYNENLKHNASECPSCHTTFNNDFHFRSFDKAKMENLFADKGFKCVEIRTCDSNQYYVGQRLYGQVFYPKWQKKFRSPICPVCGYLNPEDQNPEFRIGNPTKEEAPKGLVPFLKRLPKLIWPKYSKDYEMVALFEKKN
ncbi:MAG TPA: class I SAM-dependent methyltransferase [Puia sp.]